MSIEISLTRVRRRASGAEHLGVEPTSMSVSRKLGCAAGVVLLMSCYPRLFAADAATAGDDPNVNQVTSAPSNSVPFCSGGDRGKACVLGANCRVTEQGCQVCQCLSPP